MYPNCRISKGVKQGVKPYPIVSLPIIPWFFTLQMKQFQESSEQICSTTYKLKFWLVCSCYINKPKYAVGKIRIWKVSYSIVVIDHPCTDIHVCEQVQVWYLL